jgi:hypothetical protein
VAEEPDLTLRQIGERLAADGIHVSKSCVHTFLWRHRIRLKKDRPRRGAAPAKREEAARLLAARPALDRPGSSGVPG